MPAVVKHKYSHLALTDPFFDKPAPVELLLGADIFAQVLNGKRVIVDKDLPTAFGSSIGWILVGAIPDVESTSFQAQLVSLIVSLEEIIDRFWKLEEPEAAPDSFNVKAIVNQFSRPNIVGYRRAVLWFPYLFVET